MNSRKVCVSKWLVSCKFWKCWMCVQAHRSRKMVTLQNRITFSEMFYHFFYLNRRFKGVTFVMWQIKSGSTLLCPPVKFTPCEDLLMSCFVVWTVSGSPRGRERSCPGWGYGRKNQRNSINPGQYCWKAGFWFWVRALEIVRLYCDFSRSFGHNALHSQPLPGLWCKIWD